MPPPAFLWKLTPWLFLLPVGLRIGFKIGRLCGKGRFPFLFNLALLPALAFLLRFFAQFIFSLTLLESLAGLCDDCTSDLI